MTQTGGAQTISYRPLAIQVGQLRVRIYAGLFFHLNSELFLDIDTRLRLL
jgi:hypothetical protein